MNKQRGIEIVCCCSLTDALTSNYLRPIANHPLVSRIWIVRARRSEHSEIPKSQYVLTTSPLKPVRWLQMHNQCARLAQRKEVRAFVSFNPIPYGLISYSAAHRYQKAIHYGFIGSDWYRDCKGKTGRFLTPTLRKGSFFTVTGERMRREMTNSAFPADAIRILPHSIDLDTYPVNDPHQTEYDCIFVGQLIKRKQVDLILRSFAGVIATHPRTKLCIVGDGPLRSKLEQLATTLGIHKSVTFVGFTHQVQTYLKKARMSIIASSMEGSPFALVESMCSGLVPISTPVGTIPDLITHDVNGLLFPENDEKALTDSIARLLSDRAYEEKLRIGVIKSRNKFSYDHATAIWDPWLTSLAEQN